MVDPIYIDVCALCRPFDEQRYLRIRLETEALNLILSKARIGSYKLLVSPVHRVEIEAISDPIERTELKAVLESLGDPINVDLKRTRQRSEELFDLGFGVADAAHVAFAEEAKASFISCDDRLIKKCLVNNIRVWCGTPAAFCEREDLK